MATGASRIKWHCHDRRASGRGNSWLVGSPMIRPRSLRSSERDRVGPRGADLDIPANHARAIVKYRFEVVSAIGHPIVDVDQDRLAGLQKVFTKDILLPIPGPCVRSIDLDNRNA